MKYEKSMLFLSVGEEMKEWLRKKAKEKGDIGMSAFIRMLIAKEMKKKDDD